jgi:hypothetical protein
LLPFIFHHLTYHKGSHLCDLCLFLLKCCHASRRQCNIISFYAGMHFHIMLFLTRNLRYSQMNQGVAISWIWFHKQRSHKCDPLWYVRWWKIKGSNLKVKKSIFIRFNPRDKKINMWCQEKHYVEMHTGIETNNIALAPWSVTTFQQVIQQCSLWKRTILSLYQYMLNIIQNRKTIQRNKEDIQRNISKFTCCGYFADLDACCQQKLFH